MHPVSNTEGKEFLIGIVVSVIVILVTAIIFAWSRIKPDKKDNNNTNNNINEKQQVDGRINSSSNKSSTSTTENDNNNSHNNNASAAAASPQNSNSNSSSNAQQNNNISSLGSVLLGEFNDCKIDAKTINEFNITISKTHETLSEWLSAQTYLSLSLRQACADRGFDTKEKFNMLFDCDNLEKLQLNLPDKLELEKVVDLYHVALAGQTLESCKEPLRKGNEERYKQRLIGGRTISRKETFQQLRIYSNANKSNNAGAFASSTSSLSSRTSDSSSCSSPASPSSPTKTYDETNEGAVINGQDLPSVALQGSNLVVVNGVAGTGKTYLCEMLAIEQNVPNALVINVPLRDLAAENIKVDSVSDLLEFSVGDMLDEKQQKTIARGKVPLIFLLDGFDEVQWSAPTSNIGKFLHHFVHPSQRAKNAQNPKFKNLVRSCDVVVVTSREERTRNDNVDLDDPNAKIDHWNLMLWNNDQVLSYSKKWFKLMREDTSFDVDKAAIDVVNALRAEYMQHFFGLPLFINMICELRLDNSSSLASLSPSKVFEDLIELFWKRSKERIEKRLLLVAADYKLSKSTEVDEEFLAKLMKEAAFAGFKQLVQTVVEDFTAISFDLNSLPNKKPPLFAVLFESAGLLHFVSEKKARFPHRSYIEFLCAKFASENPATALIVPPVAENVKEKVPETILWTQKFASVWLILADFARRNEDEYQQEKERTSLFSSVNYSKIHTEFFVKHVAQVHYNKNKENDQKSDTNKGSEIGCTVPLLRLTMIVPSCDQLLDAVKSVHGIHFKPPHHFLWLVELSGKVGSIQALEWSENTYEKYVTPDLLKLALGHALDRQELPAVANFVGALTKPPRNVPVSLKHAVKTGSVVGTTIAASKKEEIFDTEKWSSYLKLAFDRQQYDVAAALLMYGDWNNKENSRHLLPLVLEPENFPLPPNFTCDLQGLKSALFLKLPSSIRIWNTSTNSFERKSRDIVASSLGLNTDIESCRVSCAKFLEEAAVAVFTQISDESNAQAAPFAVVAGRTKEFDQYLTTPSTTNIPFKVVVRFCEYLEDFVEEKADEKAVVGANESAYVSSHETLDVYRANVCRDSLLWISWFLDSAGVAEKWCDCVRSIILNGISKRNQSIFGTTQVRETVVWISRFAASGVDEIYSWWQLLDALTLENDANQQIFATLDVLRSVLTVSKLLSSGSCCNYCCSKVLANFAELEENQMIFGSSELDFCDFFSRASKLAKYAGECNAWSRFLHNLTYNNLHNRKIFAVDAIRVSMLEISSRANRCYVVYYWSRNVVSLSEANPKLFCCDEMPLAIMRVGNGNNDTGFGHTSESLYWYLEAVKTMLTIDKQRFVACPELRQVVEGLRVTVYDGCEKSLEFGEENLLAPEVVKSIWHGKWETMFGHKTFDKADLAKVNQQYEEKSKALRVQIEKLLLK